MLEDIKIFQATFEDTIEILDLQKLAYQSEAQIYNDWNSAFTSNRRRDPGRVQKTSVPQSRQRALNHKMCKNSYYG